MSCVGRTDVFGEDFLHLDYVSHLQLRDEPSDLWNYRKNTMIWDLRNEMYFSWI